MPSNSSTSDDGPFSLLPPESQKERANRLRAEWLEANQERLRAYKRQKYEAVRDNQLAKQKVAYHADPDKFRKRNRQYRFGMTDESFRLLFAQQKGRCAVCKTNFNEAMRQLKCCVDHDHEKGNVRGLLCFACNTAIGHARDKPHLLREMARYLNRAVSNTNKKEI